MAENTEANVSPNGPFLNVTSEEYDGRSFVHEDNAENVQHYVGVDPIYQNYANEGEKPFAFSKEELNAAAERGGLADELVDDEDEDEDEDEAAVAPKAAVPTQRVAPTTRASAKDETKKSDDKK